MKTNIKKIISILTLLFFALSLIPLNFDITNANANIVYPLKKISKLECRFNEYNTLNSDCIEDLPILRPSDYKRYATENGWYNKYTRIYTVLWWASYKYWWDVGYGWHMWVDIATAKWTPVYAMSDWEVVQARYGSAEWNFVAIKHNINWKTIVSNYLHLSEYFVSKGDSVRAWQQIWLVWSTWNSTWNHLHFQIDTLTTYSPIYYSKNTCPYSYYEITEKGYCFDELSRITIDPLLFLNTNWAILNSINSPTNKVTIKNNKQTNKINNSINTTRTTDHNSSIFDKNVFFDSDFGDIREVQSIYKTIWYYNWEISWNYNDLVESVIKYQLDKNIISARWEPGTWNFWPKTRAQTKKDYLAYINNWGKKATTIIPSNNYNNNSNENTNPWNDLVLSNDNRVSIWWDSSSYKTEKISRENLMTREELEAKEVNDFLKDYKINLEFENAWWNIMVWWTETLHLSITNRRNKYFRWTMPWWMTFEVDKWSLSIFPEKLFYFTDWKREIKINWLKEWNTKLNIKVWNVIVKTFNINIFNGSKSITPDAIQIIEQETHLWETKTGLWILKQWNKALTNIAFNWEYTIKASEWNLLCIKSWDLKDLKFLYKTTCSDSDFRNEVTFSYKDTVWWILIFNYKALNKNVSFEIKTNQWKKLWTKNIAVLNEKTQKNYAYLERNLSN